jgi:uncharacterized protein involved in exopolysaccharide biosynthesis
MSESGNEHPQRAEVSTEGPIYVSPNSLLAGAAEDRISLHDLWQLVWRRKALIFAITALFAIGSVIYALTATEIYRAEVLLAPAEESSKQAIGGQLGGLAALAGVNVGDSQDVEALAVLKSRDFAREFIDRRDLLPVFFPELWDADAKRWLVEDPTEAPDYRNGVRFFHDEVLFVTEERDTGLVTVAIEWTDPDVAAGWAQAIVNQLNERLRDRALKEAKTNVEFLSQEMTNSSLITMQQSIGQLLQSELQKLMLAKGNEEFAFKVIDPATPPRDRLRPQRTVIVVMGTLFGALAGMLLALLFGAGREPTAR